MGTLSCVGAALAATGILLILSKIFSLMTQACENRSLHLLMKSQPFFPKALGGKVPGGIR